MTTALTFEVFVDDDRYSVPTLYLISAQGDARARTMADSLWRDSKHHRGVELRREGVRIYVGGSYARTSCGDAGDLDNLGDAALA
jgi:hypothetical protein